MAGNHQLDHMLSLAGEPFGFIAGMNHPKAFMLHLDPDAAPGAIKMLAGPLRSI